MIKEVTCLLISTLYIHFYRNHYKVLVPVLLMKQSHQGLATVAGQLHVNETSLLKRCLPRVLVLILPKFAMATKAPSQVDRDAQRGHHLATKVYDTVVQAISKEVSRKIDFQGCQLSSYQWNSTFLISIQKIVKFSPHMLYNMDAILFLQCHVEYLRVALPQPLHGAATFYGYCSG